MTSVFLKPEIVCIPSFFIEKYKNSTKNKRLKSLVITLDGIKEGKEKILVAFFLKEKVSGNDEGMVKNPGPCLYLILSDSEVRCLYSSFVFWMCFTRRSHSALISLAIYSSPVAVSALCASPPMQSI
jgi:hypothetical protein